MIGFSFKKFELLPIVFLLGITAACVRHSDNERDGRNNCKDALYVDEEFGFNEKYGYVHERQTYDLFLPKGITEPVPLVILLHSGAFLMGDNKNHVIRKIGRTLSTQGYAAATINYSLINFESFLKEKKPRLIYLNAIRDARMAIQFFQNNGSDYEISKGLIDTENIFLAGFSAGAIVTLHTVITDSDEEAVDYFGDGLNYDGFSTDRSLKLRGAISIAGAMLNPSHIDGGDNIPILFMHGTKDSIVRIDQGKPLDKYVKDFSIDLPGLYYELGITESVEGEPDRKYTIGGIEVKAKVPAQITGWIRDFLTPTLSGSEIIIDDLTHKRKCKLVRFIGKGHTFMKDEGGRFNSDFCKMMNEMYSFIDKNVSKRSRRNEGTERSRRRRDR